MQQERMNVPSTDMRSPPERRRRARQLALLRVALLHAGGMSDICVVRNVSANGLSARVYRRLSPGSEVEIEFRSGRSLAGSVVWERDYDIGMVFPRPIDVAEVLASNSPSSIAGKRRALPRIALDCTGRLSNGLQAVDVMLRDISQGGASLEYRANGPRHGRVRLALPELPPIAGVVRWTSGASVGVSFNECLAFETLARWIQARQQGLLPAIIISTAA